MSTVPLVRKGLRRDQEVVLPRGLGCRRRSPIKSCPRRNGARACSVIQTFPFFPKSKVAGTEVVSRITAAIRTAQNALAEELDWATHLGLSAVLLPQLEDPPSTLYSCYQRAATESHFSAPSWLEVPLTPQSKSEHPASDSSSAVIATTWAMVDCTLVPPRRGSFGIVCVACAGIALASMFVSC